MEDLNLSLLWVIVIPSIFIWAAGAYMVMKSWSSRPKPASFGVAIEEKQATALDAEKEVEHAPQEKEYPSEEIIPHAPHEIKIEATLSEKETNPEELETPIKETPEPPKPRAVRGLKDFYKRLGKANIIEFPAEYTGTDSVIGLNGIKNNFIEFAKTCYTQIGFRCIDVVLSGKKANKPYKVSVFDLISDHYKTDEQGYIDFFADTKEKFSGEIASIKYNPEFIQKNMKELVAVYKNLPDLAVWNDKELFLVYVKSRHEELTQEEISWLTEFIIEKNLLRAKIFRIPEKKSTGYTQQPGTGLAAPTEKPLPEFTREAPENVKEKIIRKPFTEEEIKFLKENRDKMTNDQLAEKLERTVDSITHKLSRLGLSREEFHWTVAREKFLKNNFQSASYKKLAEQLGTTIPSVRARSKKLGLKK